MTQKDNKKLSQIMFCKNNLIPFDSLAHESVKILSLKLIKFCAWEELTLRKKGDLCEAKLFKQPLRDK